MFRRIDTLAIFGALAIHAAVAVVLVMAPVRKAHSSTTIDIEVVKPKPPEPALTPPKPVEPEKPPEPPKVIPKIVKSAAPPIPSPLPPSPEPPSKEPPKPQVFTIKEVMEGGPEDVTAQHGSGNAMANPSVRGPEQPKPGGTGTPNVPVPAYAPKGDVFIAKMPEIDGEACGRQVVYPPEAEQLGIEGDVKLKVELEETGKVHSIKVLAGLGHGLDEAAMHALKYKCHFKPAIGTDGKPTAYVIPSYTWTFELPR